MFVALACRFLRRLCLVVVFSVFRRLFETTPETKTINKLKNRFLWQLRSSLSLLFIGVIIVTFIIIAILTAFANRRCGYRRYCC